MIVFFNIYVVRESIYLVLQQSLYCFTVSPTIKVKLLRAKLWRNVREVIIKRYEGYRKRL